jgi:SOS response regulatory protein OraA/RecX
MDPYNVADAVSAGIRHIGIAVYSSGKVYEFLVRKGFDPDTARTAVAQLVEREYIDDVRAGRKVLASRTGKKQESRALLAQRLKASGISRDSIQEVLSECEDDRITCELLIKSCYPDISRTLCSESELNDIITYASRRGYKPELVTSVIRKLINEQST